MTPHLTLFFIFQQHYKRAQVSLELEGIEYSSLLSSTVTYTESGTPMLSWDSRYLCHFSTEMAEIWSPGTYFQDVWTCKILLSISYTFIVMKHLVEITN